MQNTTAACLIY